MKNKLILLGLLVLFCAVPCYSAPYGGGHGPGVRAANYHGASMHRPPTHRPPMGGVHRPPMYHGHVGMRPLPPPPPLYRPYIPSYRPYYPTTYYSTSYTYYPSYDYSYEVVQPVPAAVNTVVVRDNYAGINTAANIINTAANVAATIRYLTW